MEYFTQYGGEYIRLVIEHLQISLLAIIVSIIIGIVLGIVATRFNKTEKTLLFLASNLRIIPSLAMLIFLVPYLGTGLMPTLVALVLLGIPPVLLNTIKGINNVPEYVVEAALGMGYDKRTLFRKIVFPLALPVIFNGIQITTTEVIASTTLAAYIGAGGLGELIMSGVGLMRFDYLWIGGLSVSAISLMAMLMLTGIRRFLRKYEV